jgi:hypothetical protein
MSLLDKLKTDLSSFDYSKIGTKHGEYFGEDNATGFTPNRVYGDTTEYAVESSVQLDGWPGPVNFMKDINATGFTIGRQEQDPTEYFTQSSIKLDGFPGPVDYFHNNNATGFTLNRQQGDVTEYDLESSIFKESWPGPVDYFHNNNATGFTLDRKEKDPSEYIDGSSIFDDKVGSKNNPQNHEEIKIFSNAGVKNYDTNFGGVHGPRRDSEPPLAHDGHNETDLTIASETKLGNMLDVNLTSINQGNAGSIKVGQGQQIQIGTVSAVSGLKSNIELPFGPYIGDTIAGKDFLKKMYGKFDGNKGLRGSSRFFTEPYVIREIGERDFGAGESNAAFDEGLFRGGVVTYTNRMITDTERIGKFLLSPKGLVWNVKQFVLQRMNPRKETKNFNPLSTPLSSTGLFHEPRHNEPLGDGFLGSLFANPLSDAPRYEKVVNEKKFKSNSRPLEDTTKTDKETSKAVKSGVDYLSSRENGGSRGTLELRKYIKNSDGAIGVSKLGVSIHDDGDLQVPYQGQFGQIKKLTNDKDFPTDLIKFRIRDAVNGKWIIFPAYIEDITDNSSAEYAQERYIGRPDAVHIYQGYTRNISLTFKVAALKRNDVPIIWEKLNALKGLTTPSFKKFLTDDKEVRPVSPYVYLTIGDLFNNTPGYFSSVNVQINNTMSWEISDGVQYPHVADVSVEFVYLGKKIPQTLGKHYDIPWLKDSGVGEEKFGIFGSEDPKNSSVKYPDRQGIDIDGSRVSYGTWLGQGKSKAGPPPPPPRPTIPIPSDDEDIAADLPLEDLPF